MSSSCKQFVGTHSDILKTPPWPTEAVIVRFSRWKHPRQGHIVYQGQAGYSFVDKKGNSYQCSPGYEPIEIRLVRSEEEWSCYV